MPAGQSLPAKLEHHSSGGHEIKTRANDEDPKGENEALVNRRRFLHAHLLRKGIPRKRQNGAHCTCFRGKNDIGTQRADFIAAPERARFQAKPSVLASGRSYGVKVPFTLMRPTISASRGSFSQLLRCTEVLRYSGTQVNLICCGRMSQLDPPPPRVIYARS